MKKIVLLFVAVLASILFTSCGKSDSDSHSESESSVTLGITFNADVSMDTIVQDTIVIQAKVTLLGLSELTDTSVIIEGAVEGPSNQANFAYGICWGTIPNPTVSNYHCEPIQFAQSQRFGIIVRDLMANTKYYVRPFILKSNEFIYGEVVDTFTTSN